MDHVPTTMGLTMTGHSWTGDDSDWYDYGWNDNWTWSTGNYPNGTPVLSQPQRPTASNSTAESSNSFTGVQSGQTAPVPNVSALHSTVNVSDLETVETTTDSPSRRTGAVTRPVRTGTGLLNALVFVVAVLNSFGRHDVLGRQHEDCISSLSPKEHWILLDSGAAAHCCPLDYAPDYPLLPVGKNPPSFIEERYW